jgi:GH25 family lysozyme M1 (1,4-beta-N-acetylmuramidase)
VEKPVEKRVEVPVDRVVEKVAYKRTQRHARTHIHNIEILKWSRTADAHTCAQAHGACTHAHVYTDTRLHTRTSCPRPPCMRFIE